MSKGTEYASCYKPIATTTWNCKCGFNDVNEATQYMSIIKGQQDNICSVIIEYNKYVPNFLKPYLLKYKLTPQVKISK